MKFPWILAGIGIGVAITYIVLNSDLEPATATGYDDTDFDTSYEGLNDTARKTFEWGAKQQAKGKVGSVAGAIKEGVGNLTGNQNLADEGTADRVVGKVKDVVGQVGQAAGQTIHNLNK